MSAPNLPNMLLKLGIALAKHHIKNVIGDEALEIAASTLVDVGGEKVEAKIDSIFASKVGQKELLNAAQAADERFKEKCKDNDLHQLFMMDYGDLPSVQKAIASLPEALDDDALRETLFTAFRNDSPKSISDEQIHKGVNLYVECLQSVLIPVKDFGLRIIHNVLKEISKDVKNIKADVKLVLEKIQTDSQGTARTKSIGAHFLVPFPHNPDFVGRETELASLHDMLQQGKSIVGIRPTVLVGLGGIGKTQLAVEYAHAYRADYPSGVFWLNAINPLLLEFAKAAELLELANSDTPRDTAAQRYFEYLNQHTDTLVIFDNVEEPKNLNVPFTAGLIPANLQCRTLFTTRKRDFPNQFQSFEVRTLPESAALRLLLRHPSRQPILEPNHPDHGLARVICITVGHLPLALALASAFLGEYPEISLFDYRVRLLNEGAMQVVDATQVHAEDMPTRHETAVRATLKTSWDALTDENARLALLAAGQLQEAELIPISRLGLLTGLATQAKPGHPAPLTQALKKLQTTSLIEELTTDRLRLHPLVHAFAAQISPATLRTEMAARVNMAFEDLATLQTAIARHGVDQALEDIRTGLELCPSDTQNNKNFTQLSNLERVLDREAHHLRDGDKNNHASFYLQQMRNCAFELDLPDLQNRAQFHLDRAKLPYLRKRFPIGLESKAAIRTLEGHTSWVKCVAVTADGHLAISGSEDCTLKVWDLTTGQAVRTLKGHAGTVHCVAVTPDGHWAVSGSFDNTLKVWDLATGQAIRTLAGHTGIVYGVAVTADGRWVISACYDWKLKVWDLTTGQVIRTLEGQPWLKDVAVTADGRWAVSASEDNTLKVWDLMTGEAVRTLEGHNNCVDTVAVTADGLRVVSGSRDHTLKVWDLTTGHTLYTLEGHTDIVNGVAVTADGHRAVSTSRDKTLKVWDLTTGQIVCTFQGHAGFVNGVAVIEDGHKAVSASDDGTLKVWDLIIEPGIHKFEGHSAMVNSVAVTTDGRWAVSASHDKMVKVWDLTTGRVVRTLEGHKGLVFGVATITDKHYAISASSDNTLKVWDFTTGQALYSLEGHTHAVYGVTVTADGRWAVSASSDHTIKVWDLTTGQAFRTLKGHVGPVSMVAVTANGRWAVSGSTDKTLIVWNFTTGQAVYALEGHTSPVHAVAVTADGSLAVSASSDHTLKVWDLATRQVIRTLEEHTDWVHDVVVTTDGRWVVSVSSDMTLRVWDIRTGKAVLSLAASARLKCCAITPDGQTIVFGDDAGAVHFVDWVKY